MGIRDNRKSENLDVTAEGEYTWDEAVAGEQISEGTRVTLTGEFVTQHTTRKAGVVACRISIRIDEDTLVDVVLTPCDSEERFDLVTGSQYTISGKIATSPTALPRHESSCLDCGGVLRQRGVVDDTEGLETAVTSLNVGDHFVVCDEIHRAARDSNEKTDDWIPRERQSRPIPSGRYVCVDCGSDVSDYDLTREHGGELMLEMDACAAPASKSLGLAVGGSRDATNFRENIHEGYVPQPDALAYEGLFYDYRFPTTESEHTEDALFTPTFERASARNPVTGEREVYLSVGLDSSLSSSEFERPPLDVVAVLDTSGSMSSPFDEYYYDSTGTRREVGDDEKSNDTKMEAAAASLCALTKQLAPGDQLGVVLFDSRAHVAKPLRDVQSTDMDAIRGHIRDVRAGGGTNMGEGFDAARQMFAEMQPEREQRIVFMTDAMPNTGTTRSNQLVDLVADAASERIHTTFVGMGLDENAELASDLSAVRGANHYFVHSATEFERRLGEEFDYMVSPLVFDLSLSVDTEGYEVDGVYGVPNADIEDGRVLDVTTLFPSPTSDGESRGGIILVRLHRTNIEDTSVELDLSWDEGDGITRGTRVAVDVPSGKHFDGSGIRKAVVLSRYGRVLREWASWARSASATDQTGMVDDWVGARRTQNEHERGSLPIRISDSYAAVFRDLRVHIVSESAEIDDETLAREVEVLDSLLEHAEEERQRQ
ncbi:MULTISPECIES: VWA domain-containing protein [unclassified Haloferax]|uniref:vWA domain-containing protein n=1 Tax=unclassified Haloferax TaxID=2625095 RepID=UPI002874209B|nr:MULTISPECIES: VWA domain-containing protein [unclassified Haloferax]MDS0243555.1 VWA domain-containing protein [Haloferax sp. S2CR25]MDS0446676.1 VWA domain-containing protein [Haloferax sp. S2CR25-2]